MVVFLMSVGRIEVLCPKSRPGPKNAGAVRGSKRVSRLGA